MTPWSRLLAPAVLGVLLAGGCSVAVIPTDQQAGGRVTSQSTTGQTPAGQTPAGQTSTPETATTGDGLAGLKGEYADQVTQRRGCEDGSVILAQSAEVVELSGPCPDVRVEAAAVVLLADEIGALVVHGSASTVLATSIESVVVDSAGNQIFWSGDQPTITDTGAANVAVQITKE